MSAVTKARPLLALARNGIKDAMAGVVASVVLVANIVSFAALMFPGELSAGIPIAIWAMLVGSCIGGLWIAWSTSLPPLASGIDSPTGAVLVLLSATAGSAVMSHDGNTQNAVHAVMLVFTAATFISGALLFALGAFRWASYFRFVPYFVVGGFLAATGWLLIVGGIRMTAGGSVALSKLSTAWTLNSGAKLATAVAALLVMLSVRRWMRSAFAMPAAILAMAGTVAVVLRSVGLSEAEHGWYLPSLGSLARWEPFHATRATHLPWPSVLALAPEMLAAAIVALISLVTKVSTLEVARKTSGNLDLEFRAHGIASLVAAPFGGLMCSLQTGTSRLLEQAGGATRMSGVACALALGAVGVAQLNLPGLIPIPIVAGLVFYLGYTFLVDALWKPYAQRAWLDLALAVVIMIVCIAYGFLAGVLGGLVGACVSFAISYARLGVVRHHVTRAQFASYVSRSEQASDYLRGAGDAIQLYWLSGYIFFGSSESVFERIRHDIESLAPGQVRYVILDFAGARGADSSAVASLAKLRNLCDKRGIAIIYTAVAKSIHKALEVNGLFGRDNRHQVFDELNLGLAWCEDRLIAAAKLDMVTGVVGFQSWLQQQLGPHVSAVELAAYLERKDVGEACVVYRQGELADTLALVAEGNLTIAIGTGSGESIRVRRFATHTVVGEMGFFRRAARAANVLSDGPATLFTLSRDSFERMRRERPELASTFYEFIVRTLADRIDLANRTVIALTV